MAVELGSGTPFLAATLGVPVTSSSTAAVEESVRLETHTLVVEQTCPIGHWCSAGYRIPCAVGSYNPHLNADSQQACSLCPRHSVTLYEASTSVAGI